LGNPALVDYLVALGRSRSARPEDAAGARRLLAQRLAADWAAAASGSGNPYKDDAQDGGNRTALGELVAAYARDRRVLSRSAAFRGLNVELDSQIEQLPVRTPCAQVDEEAGVASVVDGAPDPARRGFAVAGTMRAFARGPHVQTRNARRKPGRRHAPSGFAVGRDEVRRPQRVDRGQLGASSLAWSRQRLADGLRPVVVHSALVGVSNALIALLDHAVQQRGHRRRARPDQSSSTLRSRPSWPSMAGLLDEAFASSANGSRGSRWSVKSARASTHAFSRPASSARRASAPRT
jgi:hypothetical protein